MTEDKVPEPVVLELATLPREQTGPFLLLGLDKGAVLEQIEAHWAQRVIWARKNQVGAALQEINWAREVISDPDKRVRADVTSLNPDTIGGALRDLVQRLEGVGPVGLPWQPLDVEKHLADYTPETAVPDAGEVRAGTALPEVPEEVPGVACLLEEFIQEPLDPWAPDLLPGEGGNGPSGEPGSSGASALRANQHEDTTG